MKAKLRTTLLLIVLVSTSALAQLSVDTPAPSGPPDKQKLSYAMGMKLGLQHKESGSTMDIDSFTEALKDVLEDKPTMVKEADMPQLLYDARRSKVDSKVQAPDPKKIAYALGMRIAQQIKRTGMDLDPNVIGEGIHDAAEGKPTQLKETEIAPLFNQAKAYELAKQSVKNKAEGKAFLEKNAKEPGVTVLPDGLQYKVLEEGTGKTPNTNDIVKISYHATTVEGKEIDRRYQVSVRVIAPVKGVQEALQMMKAGSKWKLFVPAELAYGKEGMPGTNIGPDTVLIYELEFLEIASPDELKAVGSGRLGHGLDGEPAAPSAQSNASNDKTSASK